MRARQFEKRLHTKANGGPMWQYDCRCCTPRGMCGKNHNELKRRYHRDYRNAIKRLSAEEISEEVNME